MSKMQSGGISTAGLAGTLLAFVCCFFAAPPTAFAAGCPNEEFRSGPSAELPDCRAYELLTPADTNGRVPAVIGAEEDPRGLELFPSELLSPSASSFVYMLRPPALGLSEPNGSSDLYEAQRSSTGWQTLRRLSPSGPQAVTPVMGGVSADHGYGFLQVAPKEGKEHPGGSLADSGTAAYLSAPDGSFELVGLGREGSERLSQGRYISEGGTHVIFTTGALQGQSLECFAEKLYGKQCKVLQLEPNAPPTGTGAVYDRKADGATHVVSLMPGDSPLLAGEQAFYKGVSKDASSVAFSVNGNLYVRIDNGEPSEETVKVAEGEPVFAGLSADGRYLFYLDGGEEGTIHRFDTEVPADLVINPTAAGEVVNVSADGSHVYFISEEEIDGSGTSGEPNLYVWSGGSLNYVATVAPSDLTRTSGTVEGTPALTRWTSMVVAPINGPYNLGPGADSSRSTPNGEVLVFESRAQLTPYDNGGHTEIYRYEDGQPDLTCISCNSDVEPAEGDARLQELRLVRPGMVIHNLSEDGKRVFFETPEPLVGRDIDEVNDIYEWRQEGIGASVDLISSGRSIEYLPPPEQVLEWKVANNALLYVSPSGGDVIFFTQEALVEGAGVEGTPALYDARIGGGFPLPPAPAVCSEESCHSVGGTASGSTPIPPSEELRGTGNVRPHSGRHHRKRCHHHRGRTSKAQKRCSKQSKKSGHRRGNVSGRLASTSAVSVSDESPFSAPPPSEDGELEPQGESFDAVVDKPTAAAVTAATNKFDEFGIKTVSAEESTSSAALHPDFVTNLELNSYVDKSGSRSSDARTEEVSVSLPPGLLGNPTGVSRCSTGLLNAFANCPFDSQVGVTKVRVAGVTGELTEPVYNLAPPHPDQEVARLGFRAYFYTVFIDVKVRTAGDYGVTATVHSAPGQAGLVKAKTTLWGDPTDPIHDPQRLTASEAPGCGGTGTACEDEDGKREVARTGLAFMTNPSACQQGDVGFSVKSYQLPGQLFTASAPLAPIVDCTGLPFAPTFEADPTSHEAGASTGLKTKLVLPQHLGADERATSTMREARVTLPEGMQVAAGAANWIGTCSEAQVGFHEEVDTACPDNAKLGTATFVSPALSAPIEGTIYQRAPEPGRQLGLWLTADALGLHVKLPGSLEPDKQTGRLTAVFTDLPQVPVEEIDLDVWGGPRAPLQNPDHCGTYTTDFSFSPHSNDPAATGQATMQVTEGCNQPFDPTLHAGVTDPVAGKYSPFVFDLTRPDGNQALRGFSLKLPDGELAKIKGVPLCSDADANAGTCPAGSRIGHLQATTGPGPEPFTLPEPGKAEPQIYLSGPYKGAPFSIVTEVPAQAGPFDLGTLAVRSGLGVEPETGRAVVKADPLPQFFEGVGIAYRHLHAVVDRPEFNLNPTDCREMAVTADVTSTQGTVAHPSARFQVDGCKALKFKPKLSLMLKGGTKRADYPALTAVLKARKGDANIAFTSVGLPHSEFLAQEHIGTICTRKQFAANKCPKGSVYGRAKAITPLLAKPLAGPVYLRSSNHPLPDLVAKLGGQLEIDLVGRIDSKHGGIRTTFESVPDAPVTRFVLQMRGGKKGLLTNSTDICRGSHRAAVAMKAQNGRAANLRPALAANECGRKR